MQLEAVALAWEEHHNNGHFHRDNVKIALMDRITSSNSTAQLPRLSWIAVSVKDMAQSTYILC